VETFGPVCGRGAQFGPSWHIELGVVTDTAGNNATEDKLRHLVLSRMPNVAVSGARSASAPQQSYAAHGVAHHAEACRRFDSSKSASNRWTS